MTRTSTFQSTGVEIAMEAHRLLVEFDPARWRADCVASAQDRMERLAARVREALESGPEAASERWHSVRERLSELRSTLERQRAEVRAGRSAKRRDWRRAHRQIQHAYEALAAGLRVHAVHVPALRPTNYARNVFHVFWGIFALLCVELLLTPNGMLWVSGAFATYAWSMEIGRRRWPAMNAWLMRHYGRVAHPHEWHRVNSATWYATALVALALTRSPMLAAVALVVLGFADPAAALIGRRYGRLRLIHGRSLEGSLTFLAVGSLAAFGVVVGFHGLSLGAAALVAVSAAFTGAVAELFSGRVDDNLTVPLATAAGAWLSLLALGIPIA